MGCDIHVFAERKIGSEYEPVQIDLSQLEHRSYGKFGFLTGTVRNYSAVPPISLPRGLPADVSSVIRSEYERWGLDSHTPSWLSVQELLAFDYDAPMEDRRVTVQIAPQHFDGGGTCQIGMGQKTTYREFLGAYFFRELQELKDAGVDRIVFWFDS